MPQETLWTTKRDITGMCVHLQGNLQRFRLCTGCILALSKCQSMSQAAEAGSAQNLVKWRSLHAN